MPSNIGSFFFILCRWWKDQDIPYKLPYMRDRIVETYFPTLGLYFEPRFSLGRIIIAKMIIIVVSLNDVCDSYATYPEAKSLIDSLQTYYYMHPVIIRLCLVDLFINYFIIFLKTLILSRTENNIFIRNGNIGQVGY